ncbi:MAG: AbrB family transcriptional regulator, partial [Rhodospirillales bacterium]
IPGIVRTVCVTVLGVLLGSGFTPEIFDRLSGWAITASFMLVYVVVTGILLAAALRRLAGYDPVTAYFAAMPGGITEMTMIGTAMGGDGRTIALIHGARILLVALTIPVGFRFFGGYMPQGMQGMGGGLFDLAAVDAMLLLACGALGWAIGPRIRLPAPQMMGALLLSAAAHATGLMDAKPPALLSAAAQLGIGAAIGCTFAGVRPSVLARTLAVAVGTIGTMLLLTLLVSIGLAALTGWPAAAILLAYAPGGVTEMSLVALAIGVDVVFVATHHIIRFSFVILIAPATARLLGRRGVLPLRRPPV